jgi:hypothetical protein
MTSAAEDATYLRTAAPPANKMMMAPPGPVVAAAPPPGPVVAAAPPVVKRRRRCMNGTRKRTRTVHGQKVVDCFDMCASKVSAMRSSKDRELRDLKSQLKYMKQKLQPKKNKSKRRTKRNLGAAVSGADAAGSGVAAPAAVPPGGLFGQLMGGKMRRTKMRRFGGAIITLEPQSTVSQFMYSDNTQGPGYITCNNGLFPSRSGKILKTLKFVKTWTSKEGTYYQHASGTVYLLESSESIPTVRYKEPEQRSWWKSLVWR